MMTYTCSTCHFHHPDRLIKCSLNGKADPSPCQSHPLANRWRDRPQEVIPQPPAINQRLKLEVRQ